MSEERKGCTFNAILIIASTAVGLYRAKGQLLRAIYSIWEGGTKGDTYLMCVLLYSPKIVKLQFNRILINT